jgi:hypothetical protein
MLWIADTQDTVVWTLIAPKWKIDISDIMNRNSEYWQSELAKRIAGIIDTIVYPEGIVTAADRLAYLESDAYNHPPWIIDTTENV